MDPGRFARRGAGAGLGQPGPVRQRRAVATAAILLDVPWLVFVAARRGRGCRRPGAADDDGAHARGGADAGRAGLGQRHQLAGRGRRDVRRAAGGGHRGGRVRSRAGRGARGGGLRVAAASVAWRVRIAEAARPRRSAGADDPAPRRAPGARPATAGCGRDGRAVRPGHGPRALTTYIAFLAIEVLGLGDSGVGLLGAAIGLGGLVGAILALGARARAGAWRRSRCCRSRCGASPLAVIGLLATPGVALAALAVVGIANAVLDIAGFTLLQRGIPNASRTAVFSVLEVAVGVGISVGGLLGLRAGRPARGRDGAGGDGPRAAGGRAAGPAVRAPARRRAPWSPSIGRRSCGRSRCSVRCRWPAWSCWRPGCARRSFAAGETLMAEGEPGDTYLVIERGHVSVTSGGQHIRRPGPGRRRGRDRAAPDPAADRDGRGDRAGRRPGPSTARRSSPPSPATTSAPRRPRH